LTRIEKYANIIVRTFIRLSTPSMAWGLVAKKREKEMKKIIVVSFLVLFFVPGTFAQTTLKERLEQHVYTLASDEMQGRMAGTEYAQMAAEYIINQWQEIGIEPFFDNSYLQTFSRNNRFQNVVGIIHGNDPVLKNEYIIIGAHYDHIGVSLLGNIRNGADDNASGVAVLIELGRELQQIQPNLKRSIILIAFDAEEMGLIGSSHFITHWEEPIENIKLMVSVDMVGWYSTSNKIEYSGSGTIQNGNEVILNTSIIPAGLNVVAKRFETSIFTATDTHPFALNRIPTLFVSTGLKSPYHTPRDEAHLIDFDGMTLIVEHLKNLAETISQDLEFESSGRLAIKHKPRQRVDFGVSVNYGTFFYTPNILLGVGFMLQINFGIFAIRPELHYDHIWVTQPSETITTNNITVPLTFVLQTPETWINGGDIFFGGYYSCGFNGKQGGETIDFENIFNRHEFGLTFGLGVFLNPFKFGFTLRFPFSDFTQSANTYNGHIRKNVFFVTLTYRF
jgi:hypothetical protein